MRYRQHLWFASVSIIAIIAACVPIAIQTRSGPASVQVQTPPNTSLAVKVTASEFKFVPTTLAVPVGQKVTITLENTGVVEHDLFIPAIGFKLTAAAGKTVSAD